MIVSFITLIHSSKKGKFGQYLTMINNNWCKDHKRDYKINKEKTLTPSKGDL